MFRLVNGVLKYAEHLFRHSVFGNAVVVVQARLRAPADVEGGKYVCSWPAKNSAQLVPVIHILKSHHFHRRACNDQPVEPQVLDIVKRPVKAHQVLDCSVFCPIAPSLQKFRLHLQGGIAQQAQKLRFGFNFSGHQVQNGNFQRADVLRRCALFRHYKYIFIFKDLPCGQFVWNLNRHGFVSYAIILLL